MTTRDSEGASLPFTRLEETGGGHQQWWTWILDLDPFAPATVAAGPPSAGASTAGDGVAAEGPSEVGPGGRADQRARQAAVAGHRGDRATAAALVTDQDARVRVVALGALDRMGALTRDHLSAALSDPDPGVRRRACELAAGRPDPDLRPQLEDVAEVAEMAAWALGERGDARVVPELAHMAAHSPDALCREAAVAALGAIGDAAGLPAILAALEDRPAVRRRAVIALAPFDGPEVEAALARARSDRDWQVRQAAEDLS